MRLPGYSVACKRPSSLLTSVSRSTIKPITISRPLATQISHSTAFREEHDKERVVILGSGWGGYNLSRKLSPQKYNPIIISPRSYFVFTPLLTDAAGGSLDFSHIVEPIRDPSSKVDFIQAAARSVNFADKTITCEATVVKSGVTETPRTSEDEEFQLNATQSASRKRTWETGETFTIPYDKLVISVGTVSKTFKTPGVRENALFFKDIGDARKVRRRVRECFELAVLPTTSPELRSHLLHFAIVGAGPTGTELAASLRDFIVKDLVALYPALIGIPRITLYDIAPKVLSMFDEKLSQYAMDTMQKEGIEIKPSHHVQSLRWGEPGAEPPYEMDPKRCLTLTTAEEGEVGVGMCVWATGNAMNKFVRDALTTVDKFPSNSALLKAPTSSDTSSTQQTTTPTPNTNTTWHVKKAPNVGALLVDGHLRVQLESSSSDDESNPPQTAILQDVYALGDNAMPETGAPPATAQATFQEAKWLATRLNKDDFATAPPFSFRNMGTLAYIGDAKALMQIPHDNKEDGGRYLPEGLTGRMAWVVWNSAYLTMSISWRNKLRVGFRWLLNQIFGRDVSRY